MARRGHALLDPVLRQWFDSDMTKLGMAVVPDQLRIAQIDLDRMKEPRVFRLLLALLIGVMAGLFAIGAQGAALTPSGIAWQARGAWRIDGMTGSVRTGDAIPP